MKVVLGIGNPGKNYENTRHNVGFLVVDYLSRQWGVKVYRRMAASLTGEGTHFGEPVVLAKPVTYVNRTGIAVAGLLERFAAAKEEVLVVCDDFHLVQGRMRIRKRGGDGGHKGLRSIEAFFGDGNFPRIRVGIGALPEGEDVVDYVLGAWTEEERKRMEPVIERAGAAISLWLKTGSLDTAMNVYNPLSVSGKDS